MKRRGLSWLLAALVGVLIILATSLSFADLPTYSIRLHHSRPDFIDWFLTNPLPEDEAFYDDDEDGESPDPSVLNSQVIKGSDGDSNVVKPVESSSEAFDEESSSSGDKNNKQQGESSWGSNENSYQVGGESSSWSSAEKSQGGSEKDGKCDVYAGSWVQDKSYPLFKPFVCPFTDTGYRCVENGRKDTSFLHWRWQPSQCNLPRFNSSLLLEKLQGKRLAFVGDSLGRNQWESLVCMLYQGVSNHSNVYESRRQQVGKGRRSFSIIFRDYKVQIDYHRSHFLVLENRKPPGLKRKMGCSLTLDHLDKSATKWRAADILIFNSGHWWTHSKVKSGRCYFIEGSNFTSTMDVMTAYEKSLRTWASWVDSAARKQLVFFRGFAPSHFSGGGWDTGGTCDKHVEPLHDETMLGNFPEKVRVVEKVLRDMKTPVTFLNVTFLTQFRKDGHIANWGRPKGDHRQDCSHWCLPGVPDTWNHLLYAALLQQ